MNEKQFFHNALESDLLSGTIQKRRLDAVLKRTPAKPVRTVRTNEPEKRTLRRWIEIPAAAVLFLLVLGIGAFAVSRGMRSKQGEALQPVAETTPAQTDPIETTTPVNQIITADSAEIKLLSELDPENRIERARSETSGLSAYDESDWNWLRETTVKMTGLSATADSIRWTVELRVPKGERTENPLETQVDVTRGMPLCFFHADSGLDTPDEGAQLVEFASPGKITFSETADEWIACIPEICAMPQTYDRFPAVLPPTGEVKITNTLFLLDRSVQSVTTEYLDFSEDGTGETVEYPVSLLGTVEHTFVFDAEALLNIADPVHIDVPLSGEYILSIHEGNGFHNERISLDGVILDAEIHYTREGVCTILSIKDPGALSEVEQESLYIALVGGPDGTGDVPRATAQDTDSAYRVYFLSRTFWGSARFGRYLIAIEPKDYAAAKEIQLFVNASYATGEADGEPREDWSWNSADGALPDLTMDCGQLSVITIPLPGVEVPTALQPTPEPADGMLEIYVYFRDDGTEEILEQKFREAYPDLYSAYRDAEHASDEQIRQAIEAKRKIAAEYYAAKNRARCLALCGEKDIVFLSDYAAMAIIRVPETAIGELRSKPFVTFIQPFEEKTSATSATDPTPVIWSARLSALLETETPETVLSISFVAIDCGDAFESAFRYQGKSLPEWRDQPVLAAHSEEYEIWYHTVYPGIDEQNRNTPGWEKHDPNELFDSYWKERHTEAEITAFRQANEAYVTARNAYSEWRDGESGKEALRKLWQQECDRLNGLGFSLMLTKISDTQYRLDGTATVERLRSFPAKDGYQYWISLQNDDSPIDE